MVGGRLRHDYAMWLSAPEVIEKLEMTPDKDWYIGNKCRNFNQMGLHEDFHPLRSFWMCYLSTECNVQR
jgi:hypothetical protein